MNAGVHLNDWFQCGPGGSYMVLLGEIEYVKAEDYTNGEARPRGEQNYLVRIKGLTETIEVFGCQVRGIIRGSLVEQALQGGAANQAWYVVP